MINTILSEKLLNALGWTVLHSLWQAFVIGIALALLLVFLQKRSAKFRYFLSGFAMLSVLGWSAITFLNLYNSNIGTGTELAFLSASGLENESGFLQIILHNFNEYFNRHLPLIVTFWLIGVAFFVLRMLGGLAYIRHLKTRHNQPLSEFWQLKLQSLSDKIPLNQTVNLVESVLVKVPMVVGYFKPVILMPVGAVNNLSVEQVEAILAHELAHIYRNDYLFNILQSVIETLFYFNPAVWWISANIRLERENCCDDIAVKICGNSVAYAKALVSLQEMHQAAPVLAMPFSKNKNQLLNRVKRILNQPQNKSNIMEKITATVMLLMAMIMLSFGSNMPFENLFNHDKDSDLTEVNIWVGDHADLIENLHLDEMPEPDTIPKSETTRIKKEKRGDMELKMKNGEIKELKIDGKEIPKEDYGDYEEEIGEMKEWAEDIPEPPAPPAPPTHLFAPAAPAPDAPAPIQGFPSPPSAAPAPPAPPAPFWNSKTKSRTITTEKGDDGTTNIIIESADGSEPIEIKVISKEGGSITIDGEEIEGLEEGDRIVIVEEIKDGDRANYFFSDDGQSFFWSQNQYFDALKKLDKIKDKDKDKYKNKDWKFKNKDWKYDKKKDKDSDQGTIWNLDREEYNEFFESVEKLAFTPKINLRGYVSPDANILHVDPDGSGTLVLPDNNIAISPKIQLKGFSDDVVIPDGKVEGFVQPQLFDFYQNVYPENEDSEERSEFFQQFYDEYKERLKDGNLSDEKRKELMEKLQKELKESGQSGYLFEYFPDTDFQINDKLFNFYYNIPEKGKKKPRVMVLPTPAPDDIPGAIYLKGSSRKVE